VVVLGVAELGLRAFGVEPHGYVLVDEDTCYYAWGPDAYDESSNQSRKLSHQMWTDEEGFRIGPDMPKGDDKCRLLAVGDSYTHGFFVRAREAYPAAVQASLMKGGYRVKVDNGGMPGDTIAEERVGVLGRWAYLKPKVVLVGQTANDLEDLLLLERRGCRLGGAVPTEFAPTVPKNVGTLRVTRISQEIAARLTMLSPKMNAVRDRTGKIDPPATPEECSAVADRYLELLLDLTRGVQGWGGNLLFVMHEKPFCGGQEQSTFDARIRTELAAAGARLVDVSDVLKQREATLQPNDSHPSPEGHRRFAESIAKDLVSSGWLDECR